MTRIRGILQDLCTFMIISRSVFLRARNVWDQSYREARHKLFVCKTSFRKSCRLWDIV